MASSWGLSWGEAWGGAWGVVDGSAPPPAPPVVESVRPSGGIPSDRGPSKEQRRRSRILLGIEAEVIEAVASRQAEALDLDEIQRRQELEGELRLRGIEFELRHLEALNRQREALINTEIGRRIRALLDSEEAILLIIAASL